MKNELETQKLNAGQLETDWQTYSAQGSTSLMPERRKSFPLRVASVQFFAATIPAICMSRTSAPCPASLYAADALAAAMAALTSRLKMRPTRSFSRA